MKLLQIPQQTEHWTKNWIADSRASFKYQLQITPYINAKKNYLQIKSSTWPFCQVVGELAGCTVTPVDTQAKLQSHNS